MYYTPIICSWEWFPENKGLVGGLILSGYGFGAFIFGFISTALVNPNNKGVEYPEQGYQDKLFPKDVSDNVPHMLRICLIMWASLTLIAISCVSRNPEYVELQKQNNINKTETETPTPSTSMTVS